MTSKTKTVLICDDEPNVREAIRYAVNKEGYSYSMVGDGLAAYDTACSEHPDLIILDVGMPGMTGYEVCSKLRATPGHDTITILRLTAFGQASDKQTAYSAGANAFMTKPFSPRDLRSKIKELLGD